MGGVMFDDLATIWWTFIILGFFAGVLSGSLGIGAGILLVPALAMFYRCPQKSAQGIALTVMIGMAMLGTYRYWQHPKITIDFRVAGLISIGAVVGVLLGTYLAQKLPSHVLRKILAVYMIVAATKLCFTPRTPAEQANDDAPPAAVSLEDDGEAQLDE